jgi:RNA polymerase sigma-70 factor (ECF subfamily)
MSDECLSYWKDFKSGDENAFQAIFLHFHKELFQYGYKIVSNKSLVDDTIQELFLELWQSRERIALPLSIKSYLFRSLRYKLIRALKNEIRFSNLDDNSSNSIDFSYESTLVQQEAQLEIQQKMLQQIKLLSPRQQEALYLRYYVKLSYQEISKIMKISSQAVTNLVFKSVKKLREILTFPENISLLLIILTAVGFTAYLR